MEILCLEGTDPGRCPSRHGPSLPGLPTDAWDLEAQERPSPLPTAAVQPTVDP